MMSGAAAVMNVAKRCFPRTGRRVVEIHEQTVGMRHGFGGVSGACCAQHRGLPQF